MDPSIQSLNRFTDNLDKVEALSAVIAVILRDSKQDVESLITKDETPWLPNRPASARSTPSKSRSSRQRGVKLRKIASLRRKADTVGGVKPTTIDPAPQLLRRPNDHTTSDASHRSDDAGAIREKHLPNRRMFFTLAFGELLWVYGFGFVVIEYAIALPPHFSTKSTRSTNRFSSQP